MTSPVIQRATDLATERATELATERATELATVSWLPHVRVSQERSQEAGMR